MTTTATHRRLMTLLSRAGVDNETRHDLVFAWTDGRTSSTRDLTDEELNNLCWKLENDFSFTANVRHTADAIKELAMKQRRSTVLAIAQRVGIHEGTDFKKFNAWMRERSVHKKQLTKYDYEELADLVKQMHALEANYKASAENAGTKAWYQHHGIPQSSGN